MRQRAARYGERAGMGNACARPLDRQARVDAERASRGAPDPARTGVPTGFTLPVRDLRAYTGAGWVVALCGDVMTMPGLSASPAALEIDIDEHGRTGLQH